MGFYLGLHVMASGLLLVAGLAIRHRFDGAPPLWISVSLLLCSIAVLSFLVIPAGNLFLTLLIAFSPISVAGVLVARGIGDLTTGSLWDSSMVSPAPSAYGRARAKATAGDIRGAVREYRRYFEEEPRMPTPLFAASILLESRGEYAEASRIYREIMQVFAKQVPVWAEAGLRLSALYENHLNNRPAAVELLRSIAARAGNPEQGKVAKDRLKGHA